MVKRQKYVYVCVCVCNWDEKGASWRGGGQEVQ